MSEINKDIEWPFATRDDLYRERTELKQDINNFRSELKQDINNLRTEVKQEIKDLNIKILCEKFPPNFFRISCFF